MPRRSTRKGGYGIKLNEETIRGIVKNLNGEVDEDIVRKILNERTAVFDFMTDADFELFKKYTSTYANDLDMGTFISTNLDAPAILTLKFILFCFHIGLIDEYKVGVILLKITPDTSKQFFNDLTEKKNEILKFWNNTFTKTFTRLNGLDYYFDISGGKSKPLDKLNKSELMKRLEAECKAHPKKVCDKLCKSMKKDELLNLCKSLKC